MAKPKLQMTRAQATSGKKPLTTAVAAKPAKKEVDIWAWAASPQAREVDAGQKAKQAASAKAAEAALAPAKAKAAASRAAVEGVNKKGLKGRRRAIDNLIEKG